MQPLRIDEHGFVQGDLHGRAEGRRVPPERNPIPLAVRRCLPVVTFGPDERPARVEHSIMCPDGTHPPACSTPDVEGQADERPTYPGLR